MCLYFIKCEDPSQWLISINQHQFIYIKYSRFKLQYTPQAVTVNGTDYFHQCDLACNIDDPDMM